MSPRPVATAAMRAAKIKEDPATVLHCQSHVQSVRRDSEENFQTQIMVSKTADPSIAVQVKNDRFLPLMCRSHRTQAAIPRQNSNPLKSGLAWVSDSRVSSSKPP